MPERQEEQMAVTDRMMRAAQGQVSLYEEVEHDPAATTEALTVVVIVAIAGGVGSGIAQVMAGRPGAAVVGLILGIISGLIGWAVFAGVTYFIGTKLFNAEATWEEVLRTLGYSYSPTVLGVLSFIPVLGPLITLIAGLWTLYLVFVAMRSALDISTGQTIGTILLAIIPTALIIGIISLPLAAFR
jgi:hypothetical protein